MRLREALLQHYSSQLRGHGWYLLTSVVAILTGMQASAELANWSRCFAIWVFSLSVSFGLAFIIHSIGRILYYGESCRFIIEDPQQLPELRRLSDAVKNHIEHGNLLQRIIALLFSGDLRQLWFPGALAIVIWGWAYLSAINIFN